MLSKSGNVKVILMEWNQIQKKVARNQSVSYNKLADEAIRFLIFEANYSVFTFPRSRPTTYEDRMSTWTENVVFALPGHWKGR